MLMGFRPRSRGALRRRVRASAAKHCPWRFLSLFDTTLMCADADVDGIADACHTSGIRNTWINSISFSTKIRLPTLRNRTWNSFHGTHFIFCLSHSTPERLVTAPCSEPNLEVPQKGTSTITRNSQTHPTQKGAEGENEWAHGRSPTHQEEREAWEGRDGERGGRERRV